MDNVKPSSVTTDKDTASELPTLNQMLEPEKGTRVLLTDTTNIDLPVETEDKNVLPELEQFD